MRLGKDLDIFLTSEGRMIGWKDLEEIRDGVMIEVGLRMKGGGKKKGTKNGNQWESLTGNDKGIADTDKGEETIENESDTNKEDWGHSLEQKRANSRRERRERERANWNSGGQIRLSGSRQGHWEGEMGSWYQDQWWDSGTWREGSEAKGFG